MWYFNSTITYLVLEYLYGGSELAKDFTVETNYGTVRGLRSAMSRNGRNYYEFFGIPYARPPLGEMRFEPPVPPYTWDGILNATSPGNRCLQVRVATNSMLGDEDCLNLNVFTHQIQAARHFKQLDTLHPVIYYLHGGFFMSGSSDVFGAKYYMDEDVVLVTANYRVASLGFLNTGDEVVRGNMGLKDQTMVLRWIQENIQYFGGDPNRVTIVGESAGGVSAHYHMLSPMSKGLFHRAISQSGNVFVPWGLHLEPGKQALHFAEKLNCTRETTKEMIACLKKLDGKTLIQGHYDAMYHLDNELTIFRPSVEAVVDEQTFLADLPINIIKNGGTANIPWISGVNSDEGLVFAAAITRNETRRRILNENWKLKAPQHCAYDNEITKDEISEKVWNYYIGDSTASITEDSWQNLTMLMSDIFFFKPLHNIATIYQNGLVKSPLYLYYYTYRADFSLGKIAFGMTGALPVMADVALAVGVRWFSTNVLGRKETHYGSAHMDEVFLQFEMPFLPEHKEGVKDYEMSVNLIKLWTSFARDGKPQNINGTWSPVQQIRNVSAGPNADETLKYLRLDRNIELIEEPFQDRIRFWKSLHLQSESMQTIS